MKILLKGLRKDLCVAYLLYLCMCNYRVTRSEPCATELSRFLSSKIRKNCSF